ncbi:MAG: pyridoxamine 5'-phosphate oxidase [Micromonosporaceae bacterium]|nr:pyridoxamine 5'-phosphate oxidase [Micromonosporaceae bacterium]
MQLPQGDVRLLHTEAAQRLLRSQIPARFAFVWSDGTPRVIPTWFHWNGTEIVTATYAAGPAIGIRHAAQRVKVLRAHPHVALTIDTDGFPPEALTVRGVATVDEVDGLAPEYLLAASRYLGEAGAAELASAVDQPGTRQYRIVVRPTWVGLIDFRTRLPSVQGGVTAAENP